MRSSRSIAVVSAAALCFVCGCAPAHYARAIGKDNLAAGIGLGGPFVRVSSKIPPIPAPVATVWAKFGFTERMDLYSELTLTTLAFGTVGWSFGAVYQAIHQRKALPGLALHGGMLVVTDFDEARLWPHLGLALSYKLGRASLIYLGVDTLTQLDPPQIRFAPLLGVEIRFSKHISFTLEGRWYAPGYRTELISVPGYVDIAGQGALGILLGFSFHLDTERP